MKKITYNLFGFMLILLLLTFSVGCKQKSEGTGEKKPTEKTSSDHRKSEKTPENMSETFKGKVVETIDAGRYTYVQVDTGEKKVWVAAPTFKCAPGDTIIVPPGLPMAKFKSATLNREFDMIYFVGAIRREGEKEADKMPQGLPKEHPPIDEPSEMQMAHSPMGMGMGKPSKTSTIEIGTVKKAEDGQTVSEIITDRKNLAGKTIKVRAKVVKFTPNIMGKNWLHVRDGSGDEGTNDLIVTTKATVNIGDVVLISGVVSVEKDLGLGLKYSVLVEDAEVTLK